MPYFVGDIDPAQGPLIRVHVSVDGPLAAHFQQHGQPLPRVLVYDALIDTGASGVCISDRVIREVKPRVIDQGKMLTPSSGPTGHTVDIHAISLAIPCRSEQPKPFAFVRAMASTIGVQGIDLLIGRDILGQCLLVYDGLSGKFTVAY